MKKQKKNVCAATQYVLKVDMVQPLSAHYYNIWGDYCEIYFNICRCSYYRLAVVRCTAACSV